MKKILLSLMLASLSLTGCIAVPVDGGYGRGYAPAAVVVRPYHGGYYGGGRGDYR